MGNATTTLQVLNSTAWRVTLTAQTVTPNPDTPIGAPQTVTIGPGQTAMMLIKREQAGDVRCNISANFGSGHSGTQRINVKPNDTTINMQLTNDHFVMDGKPEHQIYPPGGAPPPPASTGSRSMPQPHRPHVEPHHPHHPPHHQPHHPPHHEPHRPHIAPHQPAHHPPPHQAASGPQAVPPHMLPANRKVVLRSISTGKNLRICQNGAVDALGGDGALVNFIIDPSAGGFLRLRSEKTGKYLALREGALVTGTGGKFCELSAFTVSPQVYCLRSAHNANLGVGVESSGQPRKASDVKYGKLAQFNIKFI